LAAGRSVGDVYRMLTDSLGWPQTQAPAELLAAVREHPDLLDAPSVATPWVVA
jgi:hypothetical protein